MPALLFELAVMSWIVQSSELSKAIPKSFEFRVESWILQLSELASVTPYVLVSTLMF